MKYSKRITEYLITIFIILTLNFFLPRLMPGDPFTFISSDEGSVSFTYTEEQIARYMEYYGLDRPVLEQYKEYILNTFKGNLGYSIYYNDSVLSIIIKRAGWTTGIVIASLLISSFTGTVLGAVSAWNRNSFIDKAIYIFMIVFSEIPAFLIGILLLFFIAANTGLFPLSGGITVFARYSSNFEMILDIIRHAFLPVAALSLSRMGGFYLLSRNSTISVLSKDYMRTAEAKGLRDFRIIFIHGLKNAILPILTRIFLSLGGIFGGAILVENVFNYPGLGRLMRDAVIVRDYPLIQGIFLFVTLTVLLMNFLADILYQKIDPRVD